MQEVTIVAGNLNHQTLGVEAPRIDFFGERLPVRRPETRKGAAPAVFDHCAEGRKDGAPVAVIPKQPRAEHTAKESGKIGPAVAVEVLQPLAVKASQKRKRPVPARRFDEPECQVCRPPRALVDEQFTVAREGPL